MHICDLIFSEDMIQILFVNKNIYSKIQNFNKQINQIQTKQSTQINPIKIPMDLQQSSSHEQEQHKKKQQQQLGQIQQQNSNKKIEDQKNNNFKYQDNLIIQSNKKEEQQAEDDGDNLQDKDGQQLSEGHKQKQVQQKDKMVVEQVVYDQLNNNQSRQHESNQSKRDSPQKISQQQNKIQQQKPIPQKSPNSQPKFQQNTQPITKICQQQHAQKSMIMKNNQILQQDINIQQNPVITQVQKLKYINTIQNKLKFKDQQIKLITNQSKLQFDQISSLTKTKIDMQTNLQKNIQEATALSNRYQLLQKQSDTDKHKIGELQELLSSYREVGDIKLLKGRLQELQILVKSQHKQISIMKQNDKSQMISENLSKQYIQKIQKYQNQKQQLQATIKQLQILLNKKNNENAQNILIMNEMDKTIKTNIQKIDEYEQQLKNNKNDRQNEKFIYQTKIKDLQKYINANLNNLCMNQKQFKQKQKNDKQKQDQTLMIKNQKDIIFRQYLRLQINYQNLQQNVKQFKNKYLHTSKQLTNIKKQMVTKRDYQQLLHKYKKCKLYLQKAIQQNKYLRNNTNDKGPQLQIKGSINILNQQQQNIKQYLQIFHNHVKQSTAYLKQSKNIMENLCLDQFKQQINSKQFTISQLQDQNQRLSILNNILQKQLIYKNQLLEKVVKDSKSIKHEYLKLQKQKADLLQNLRQNITAKSSLERLQIKSTNLILRNRAITAEKDNYKNLYQELKNQYEIFINRDSIANKQSHHKDKELEDQNKDNGVEQGEIEQSVQQKQKKVVQKKHCQIQTVGLSQFYYKQIKQTLLALKKVPSTIEKGGQNIQELKKQFQTQIKKYESLNNKFNNRFKKLQNQRNQNQIWRQNTTKQIKNQFQSIRQFIQNNRLVQCLRKAKNLIQGLDQEEEQGEVS